MTKAQIPSAGSSIHMKAGEPPGTSPIENKLQLAEDYLLASKILAAQRELSLEVRLWLPSGQLVAHAAEMLLKAMVEANGLEVPKGHDLHKLADMLLKSGVYLSDQLKFVVKHLGPPLAGHVFRYGAGNNGVPTAQQMIDRLEPELDAFRKGLMVKSSA